MNRMKQTVHDVGERLCDQLVVVNIIALDL